MTAKKVSYKKTIISCYCGNFVMATVINFVPVIFIPLRTLYGLSYAQLGLMVFVNFITQVTVDIAFSRVVDKYGYRPFLVAATALCFFGFLLFAAAPIFFPSNIFLGLLLGIIIFASASGLFELLLSPVIDSIPAENKGNSMALLHSFYAWGQVTVVLVTTLLLFAGVNWQLIILMWAVVPFVTFFLFLTAPMPPQIEIEKLMTLKQLLKNKVFLFAFFAIMLGGMSEVAMNQWISAFMERGLGFEKITGDLLGMCGFALMLGLGRLLYGIIGHKVNLNKALMYGSLLAAACYLTASLTSIVWLALAACIICGFGVSLLWPGTLVVSSRKLPLGGAAMFALLAAAGDIGASIGPWFTSLITDFSIDKLTLSNTAEQAESLGLKIGLLFGTIFPLLCFVMHFILYRMKGQKTDKENKDEKEIASAVKTEQIT